MSLSCYIDMLRLNNVSEEKDTAQDYQSGCCFQRIEYLFGWGKRILLFAGLLLGVFILFVLFTHSPKETVLRKGNTVILALYAYHSDHQEYPPSLDNLVPEYLDTHPFPDAETRSRPPYYQRIEEGFLLTLFAGGWKDVVIYRDYQQGVNDFSGPAAGWYYKDDSGSLERFLGLRPTGEITSDENDRYQQ